MTTEMKQKPLDDMKKLMEALGDPQDELKFVHVAGTNGKGSTSCMIANVLNKAGYRAGLYTSPYLQRFNERIRVDGKSIPEKDLAEIMELVSSKEKALGLSLSEFEKVTAAGFIYFKRMKCDIVVLEVGIGGLYDATNIIKTTLVSVITAIGLDHTEKLGSAIPEIAFAKAGIIKENTDTVVSDQGEEVLSVVRKKCFAENSELTVSEGRKAILSYAGLDCQIFTLPSHGNFEITLLGKNQVENAASAIEALKLLRKKGFKISDEDIREGLKNTLWAGRFERIKNDPDFILDCGHNVHCMKSLKENVRKFYPGKKPVILTGVMKDKKIDGIYDQLDEIADTYAAVNCEYERALPAESLKEFLEGYKKPVYAFSSIEEGIYKALELAEKNNTFVLATGSVYVCGDIRTILTGEREVPVMRTI